MIIGDNEIEIKNGFSGNEMINWILFTFEVKSEAELLLQECMTLKNLNFDL